MLTQKEIYDQAKKDAHNFPLVDNAHEIGFVRGATWANDHSAQEIARLEAGKGELLDALYLAKSHLKNVVNTGDKNGLIPFTFISAKVGEFEKIIEKYDK